MLRMNRVVGACIVVLASCSRPLARGVTGPDHVDITWMSVTNMFYEIGAFGVVTDGYISRVPRDIFYGAATGMAQTRIAQRPDVAAVRRVLTAIGGPSKVQLLLTGHSHFDHSFDTATWARAADAPVIGSRTTCYQAIAQQIPASRCTIVNGGEHYQIADGVTMWVVRFNHSGDHETNPDQHDPMELDSVPRPAANGGLRVGLQEDFPNGGGNRAYLFVVDGPTGRYSWFFNNSASAVDFDAPIVVGGVNFGAPSENLKTALRAAGVDSVDLWVGAGSTAVMKRMQPILRPRAFLPIHWDDFWSAFDAGVASPYSDPATDAFLREAGVKVIAPRQYMDKWRLSRDGIAEVENAAVKRALGFK